MGCNNKMALSLPKIVLLLSLLVIVQLYSIEATWKLRTSEISALKSLRSPIYFQFSKQLSSDGKSFVGYLTVTACNILMYNYEIDDSQIYLTFVSVGRATRSCLSGEMAYLRGQLDLIFYFYMMRGTLLLMPPNNDLPIKCDIYPTATPPPINGIWTITDGISNKINDPIVVINGSRIAFCGGTHTYNYKTSSVVKINVTSIQSNSTCNPQLLQVFSNSTLFFRLNTLVNPRVSSFFNQNSEQILQLTFQSAFISNKAITTSSFPLNGTANSLTSAPVSSINNSIATNNTTNGNKTTGNNNIYNASDNQTIKTNSSIQLQLNTTSNASANNISKNNPSVNSTNIGVIQNNKTNNSPVSISSNSNNSGNNLISTLNNNQSTNNSNTSQSITNKANTTILPNITSTNNSSSTALSIKLNTTTNNYQPTLAPPISYSLVDQASSIFGIWYPSPSFLPNQLTASDISAYQLLINGAFLLLRGGCNTIISPYSFTSGAFTPNKITSTSNSCPNSKDSILQAIIFNPSNLYYISGSSTNSIIRIASSNNVTQLLLTPNAPSN